MSAAAAARGAQPLWSLVPVSARAQYIRRAAVAMLDELDGLSLVLAEETGWPREQVVVAELLPAARGLHELADDGPRALADKRVWSVAGRRARIVHAPVGVIGLRGPSGSPWAEPALETAASLLAGNGVLLGVPAQRLRNVFLRAGVPGELVELSEAFDGVHVIDLPRPGRRGTLLVLNDAPHAKVVDAALRNAFTAGRIVTVAGNAAALVDALSATLVGPDDPRFAVPTGFDARRHRDAGRGSRDRTGRARGARRGGVGLGAGPCEGRARRPPAAVADDVDRPARRCADARRGADRSARGPAPAGVARCVGAGAVAAAGRGPDGARGAALRA